MRVLLRSLAAWVRCATTGARAMSIADQIAGYVSETGYADFDPVAIERTKDLCLSSIGSAVLGARMAVPAILAAYEIGRASCRESVCQYVSISVVAVALTKHNKKSLRSRQTCKKQIQH